MDYLPTPSDRRYLLPFSSSRRLNSAERRGSGRPPETSSKNDFALPSSVVPQVNTQSGRVISKIEDILEQLVDCIIHEKKELVLHFKSRIRSGSEVLDVDSGVIKSSATMEARTIRFPGRTAQEAWKFSKVNERVYSDPG